MDDEEHKDPEKGILSIPRMMAFLLTFSKHASHAVLEFTVLYESVLPVQTVILRIA